MTLWDPGLQPERTLLAWRRTCLSFAIASAVAVRFTVESVGVVAVAAGIVGVALSLVAFAIVSRRYRNATRSLSSSGILSTDAVPLLIVTVAAVLLGVVAAGYATVLFLAEVLP